jgi:hypothetical protein
MLLDTYGHHLPSESVGFADALTQSPKPQRTATEPNSPPALASEAIETEALPQREIA